MLKRYLTRVALTSLAVILAGAAATPPPCRQLYSARVFRRMRTELQLRLLQAHRQRLALAIAAIRHKIPIDALLELPNDEATLTQGSMPRRSFCRGPIQKQ